MNPNINITIEKIKKISKFLSGINMINGYDIIRDFSYQELKFFNEENLQKIASEIGPISIFCGTTEFDIPAFLRKNHYKMSDKEINERILFPQHFKLYEIYFRGEGDTIEGRCIWSEKEGNKIFNFDYWTNGKEVKVTKEKTMIENYPDLLFVINNTQMSINLKTDYFS